jgi:hypothetical protein
VNTQAAQGKERGESIRARVETHLRVLLRMVWLLTTNGTFLIPAIRKRKEERI